jgi:hypothetical protein
LPCNADGDPKYIYYTVLDQVVWYHSGGHSLSGTSDDCPAEIRKFFKLQYLGATKKFLSDLTLQSVVSVQKFLKASGIDYEMSFIYDIHKPYTEWYIEPGCGSVDVNSNFYNLVNWEKLSKLTPFEWCRMRPNFMDNDQFHWNYSGAVNWFKEAYNIDLLS